MDEVENRAEMRLESAGAVPETRESARAPGTQEGPSGADSSEPAETGRPTPPAPAILGNVFEAAKLNERAVRRLPAHAAAESGPVPCYRDKAEEIRHMLVANRCLALLLIDATHLARIEHDYGSTIYEQVRNILTSLIQEMQGVETRRDDLVTVAETHGDVFLIFLSKKREERPFGQGDLETMADRIHGYLTRRLSRMTSSYLKGRPRIGIGYGLVLYNPLIKEDRLVLQLIDDAKEMAQLQEQRLRVKSKELLQEIILKEDIRTLYQPIIDLNTRATLGYEGLTRGPQGTEFESPYMLFDVANESDLLFELDRLCRRNALCSAPLLKPSHKLFVNLLPTTIRDPEFRGERMLEFLASYNLSPSRIVLEITERLVIENYELFLEAMKSFTDQGFSIAIDDMGAGYSGLEKIVHLNPKYLKFDLMMVRDIDTSFVKREMLKAIHSLAQNVGADVVAEGIERVEELEALLELEIPYGQGFLFARPSSQLVEVPTITQSAVAEVPGLIVD